MGTITDGANNERMNGACPHLVSHSKWEREMKLTWKRPPRLDRFTACLASEHIGCDIKLEFYNLSPVLQE